MPVNRMRMRPWLCQMIDSGTISGLEWINEEKNTFTIPWKHAARHGWNLEKDACLFQKWAVHTGKYTAGQTSDPKTWKANFRCALNSLPDIEEVKDRSVNKGHHAMRVFRMLPQASKSREKRAKARASKTYRRKSSSSRSSSPPCSPSKSEKDTDNCETRSCADESAPEEEVATQENTVGSSTPDSSSRWSTSSSSSSSSSSSFPSAGGALELNLPDFSWSTPDTLHFRFQVSPSHSIAEYDTAEDIIEICTELERLESTLGPMGWNSCSPTGDLRSDSSDNGDEEPFYTTLGSNSLISDWKPFESFH